MEELVFLHSLEMKAKNEHLVTSHTLQSPFTVCHSAKSSGVFKVKKKNGNFIFPIAENRQKIVELVL